MMTAAEGESVRYRILGSLEVWNGHQWVAPGPAKWRTLLAVLLCDVNQVVSTDRLLEELWGQDPPRSAGKLLQGYVSQLRRLLSDESGEVLATQVHGYRAQGYRLVARPTETDAGLFEQLVEQARRDLGRDRPETAASRLSEALKLWDGPPFASVPPTLAVEAETARLEECHAKATEARIEAELRCGRHDAVLSEVEGLVAAHPLREGPRGQLMVALYRAGRRAEALAAYRDLRRRLTEELGVEPGPSLQRLHQQLLTADTALLPPDRPPERAEPPPPTPAFVPRQLPPTSTAFIGRESEASVLGTLLDSGRHDSVVISAIDGIGGIGKSSLAIQTAHRFADRFPDGQLYADLRGSTAGVAPLTPVAVLGRFLGALGVEGPAVPTDPDEAAAMFRSLTADRRLLVVLDNAVGVEQVRPLLPAGAECGVLITSREMLTTLEGTDHLHLGELPRDQARTLLERLVGHERTAAEPDAVNEIIRICGGLPLALRIVGARLAARPRWPLRSLVDRLLDTRTRLDELQAGDLAVRASFHAGYDSLCHSRHSVDQHAARALRLLGALPGEDVGLPVAAALLDLPAERTEDALERLTDAQLLHAPQPHRYRMHDLVRLFARELAERDEAEHSAALVRVLRCYLDTTLRALSLLTPDLHPPGATAAGGAVPLTTRDEAETWLETERPNLVAAVAGAAAWAESPAPARLSVRLARSLQWFLYPRAHMADLWTVNEVALSTARRIGDRAGEAWALDHLSAVHWLSRDYDGMRACLESALAIWREIGDREGEQRSLCNLADALTEQGRYDEAVKVQEGQLANARETGDRVAEVIGLGNLGRSYRGLGRTEDALACFDESLEQARRIEDADLAEFALYEVGVVHMEQGRFEEAWEHMTRALPVWTKPGAAARWRGHTWSALFPACVRLHSGPDSPAPRP